MAAFDFSGPQGSFAFDLPDWHFTVELAERYGWQPAGTVFDEPQFDVIFGPPDAAEDERDLRESRFLNDYFSNSGQWLTPPDAQNMANSLENALPDIPDHDAMSHKLRRNARPMRIAYLFEIIPGSNGPPRDHDAVSAFEWFSGKEKQRLIDFIRFCQAGGFRIE